jgi:hypothetical protein
VYEPEVVIVDRGPDAIRAMSPDGLTWTIDAKAPHVNELAVGKIAFVSGRCFGRVLKATPDGDTVRLVLGPVDLTDVFKALDVAVDEPVDLDQTIDYGAPQYDGVTGPIEVEQAALPEWSAAIQNSAGGHPVPAMFARPQRPVSPGIPQALDVALHTTPFKKANGPGVDLEVDDAGIRLHAQAQLLVKKPELDFHLTIDNKKVDARIFLKNAVGLRLAFDAAAGPDFKGNVNWYAPVPPPGELTIPVGTSGLVVNLRQEVWVQTQFASRAAKFGAGGEYAFTSDIGFTYRDEKFDFKGPVGITVNHSLMSSMGSVSLTPLGLVVSHQSTITAGVGSWGFTSGPTLDVGTSLAVRQGSSIGIVQCQGVAISMNVRGGVGWSMPEIAADVVNKILSLISVPPIKREGGIKTDWKNLFVAQSQTDTPICKGK